MSRKNQRESWRQKRETKRVQNQINISVMALRPGMLVMSHVPAGQTPALFVRSTPREPRRHGTKSISSYEHSRYDALITMEFILANGKSHESTVVERERIWIIDNPRTSE